jgi:hypothetical protein
MRCHCAYLRSINYFNNLFNLFYRQRIGWATYLLGDFFHILILSPWSPTSSTYWTWLCGGWPFLTKNKNPREFIYKKTCTTWTKNNSSEFTSLCEKKFKNFKFNTCWFYQKIVGKFHVGNFCTLEVNLANFLLKLGQYSGKLNN